MPPDLSRGQRLLRDLPASLFMLLTSGCLIMSAHDDGEGLFSALHTGLLLLMGLAAAVMTCAWWMWREARGTGRRSVAWLSLLIFALAAVAFWLMATRYSLSALLAPGDVVDN